MAVKYFNRLIQTDTFSLLINLNLVSMRTDLIYWFKEINKLAYRKTKE